MNEHKNLSLNEKGKEEESDEDYQIIKEDYHSSPRCGIKVKIVKRVIKNISFSPLEISPKPYFKYCVTQIKEEEKNDDLKISKKDINNNRDISIMNEENKDEKETEESNYMQIVEKKSSEITVNMAFKCNEINEKIEKENLKNNNNNNKKEIKKILHHSLKSNKEEFYNNNHKSNQTNIYNFFNNIVIQENSRSNKFINNKNYQPDENTNKDINKEKKMFNFHSINIKRDKADEKKIIPKKIHLNSDKNEFISFTTNNIKKLKKVKKFQDIDNKMKKKKAKINRQSSFIPNGADKKRKIHIDEKDNMNKKKSRHSLVSKDEDIKENRNIFINILKNNEYKNKLKKTKSKQKKTKSLEEKDEVIKFEKYKKLEKECGTPKRRINCKYKLKMDDSFKESESNNKNHLPKSSKGKRRVSFFESNNNNENRKRKSIFNEEKNLNLFRKKKSIFCKDKEKEKFLNNIKEKKIRNQKSKRNKTKEKDDKNRKMKKQQSNANQLSKKVKRRDKSFTIASQTNQNLIKDECLNNNNNINNNKSFNSSKSKIDNKPELNKNNISKNDLNRSDIRRKSTQNVLRDNERKEKITDLTNKQKIDNMNEYTRQCLQLIPDLYELEDKMPRCKTKINPNFSKDKKIALFDLDETIVHCIGEINMNNIESLSLQSDARIKVCLPGGKREVTIGINIRPHWEEALSKIKEKYHIVAFTASHESYADSVLNYLDPDKKYFEYRLYRCHCVLCVMSEMKFYIKDLKILEDNYDLKDVVIIDNSVLSFAYHLDNGIPISPFYNSKDDIELLDVADFLVKYADENDIRDKLKEVYTLNQFLEILKYYSSEDKQSSDISDNEEEEKENEKTSKKAILNKNKTNLNLNHVDTDNKNINNDNDKNGIISNKNASKINLSLKDISNMFKDNINKEEKEKSKFKPKLNGDVEVELKKQMTKNFEERKHFRYTKREKQKTFRFDINFKKEWHEKQKELKNKEF